MEIISISKVIRCFVIKSIKQSSLQESIRPSADLRNHYNEISKQCKENKEAVIITVNGRGDTVSLSYEEYKNMKARIEMLEILAEVERKNFIIGNQ